MKAVLMSIQPKWCDLIVNGRKKLEIRKNRPKIEAPFKVYIYCTKVNNLDKTLWIRKLWYGENFIPANGKVIGEFVCDEVCKLEAEFTNGNYYESINGYYFDEDAEEYEERVITSNDCENPSHCWLCRQSCISFEGIKSYIFNGNSGFFNFYGWHISDLIIYDKPKELSDFYTICPEWDKEAFTAKCHKCRYYSRVDAECRGACAVEGERPVTRASQSWCYVEEEQQ